MRGQSIGVGVLWSVTAAVALAGSSVRVADLRCEYLVDPLGIDVVQPRLSWRLERTDAAQRGQAQTAYQVRVASHRDGLGDVGDLWESGEVASDDSTLIAYEGRALRPGDRCFWWVRVRDEHGVWSAWSPSAHWTIGPLSPDDWAAEWIGSDQSFEVPEGIVTNVDCTIRDPWFRKAFRLDTPPRRAELHLASIGYHEVYVNGRRVGDHVLSPAVSDHSHRARYKTYDIAPLLHEGANVIAVWLGTSWSIFPAYQTDDRPATPMLLAQCDVQGSDGSTVRVISDPSWKTAPSPNRLLGTWFFQNYGGERYDARLETPGWNEVGFDDTAWQPATAYEPAVKVSAQRVEPNRVAHTLKPAAIEPWRDGAWRVDFGRNFAGLIEVDLTGAPGDTIVIESSEQPGQAKTFGLRSEYVIGPSGTGKFRSRFNYHSGRWLTIRGLSRPPHAEEVRGQCVRTAFRRVGQFQCSDPAIERVYETTLWTLENLSLGGYVVDCPQRERMGYGGDAHATIFSMLANYDVGAFYTKWNQDWADVQDASGYLPNTSPTYWGGGGPAWGGYCVTQPWALYRTYGDRRVLAQSLPVIERWLAFLESHTEGDLLTRYDDPLHLIEPKWAFLSDWLWPDASGTNSHTPETLFYNNCVWVYTLRTAAQIAEEVGHRSDAERWLGRAEAASRAIHEKYFDAPTHTYSDGSQRSLAIALVAGVPPSDRVNDVWRALEARIVDHDRGHIDAGITAGAMLTKLLLDSRRSDLLHLMATRREYPGWRYLLDQGATTLTESWNGPKSHSQLHSSYAYVGAWPITGVAGIRPGTEPGFARFEIDPQRLDAAPRLEWFSAKFDSPRGVIESSWREESAATVATIEVPPNTTCDVYLPVSDPALVTEAGMHAADSPAIDASRENGRTRLTLRSGRYELSFPRE